MSKTIHGVPETLDHAATLAALASLGFDTKTVRCVNFTMTGAYVEVHAPNSEGKTSHLVPSWADPADSILAVDRVYIPFTGM
jgi:hypothetical protein